MIGPQVIYGQTSCVLQPLGTTLHNIMELSYVRINPCTQTLCFDKERKEKQWLRVEMAGVLLRINPCTPNQFALTMKEKKKQKPWVELAGVLLHHPSCLLLEV